MHGQSGIQTPNLDALAERGTLFRNAFTPNPICVPARATIMTGNYSHVCTGTKENSGRILARSDPRGRLKGLEDYYDYLAEVGWSGYTRAHGIGNNDVRPCPSPLPAEHHVDRWVADCTIRRIDQHRRESGDSPFFMFMSSPKPHCPYDPPQPYDTLYDPRAVPPPFKGPTKR